MSRLYLGRAIEADEKPEPVWMQALVLACAIGLAWVAWCAFHSEPRQESARITAHAEGP